MGARAPRRGSRIEREVVALHREAGLEAERTPLSGALGGDFAGDVIVAGRLRAEVKARAKGDGFRTLERWLGPNDLLFLRRNGCAPLVVMDFSLYARLLATGSALDGRAAIGRGAARWKERRAAQAIARRAARRAADLEARQCALTLEPEREGPRCPQP